MTKRAGYWVDLTGMKFDDQSPDTSWIQIMTLGTYNHPWYGKVKFSEQRLQRFADNVNTNVVGKQLDIDYDHKMSTGEAAGWIQEVEYRSGQGLFAEVKWTPSAKQKIQEGAYRYFSPEFADQWKHPKTNKTFKDVLFGGGITNRPFLKDILPINMSETFGDEVFESYKKNQIRQGGGKKMAKKFEELTGAEIVSLAEAFGLGESATSAEVKAALAALTPAPEKDKGEGGSGGDGTQQLSDEQKKILADAAAAKDKKLADGSVDSTLLADVAKLVGDNPAMKVLAEVMEAQEVELNQTRTALRFSEAQGKITKLNEMALQRKQAFPASVEEDLRDLFIDSPKEFSDKVFLLLEKIAKTGLIQLGEIGRTRNGGGFKQTFHEQVMRKMSDEKLSYVEAANQLAASNPKLYEDYRADSSMAGD
jgi:phage I-like protein